MSKLEIRDSQLDLARFPWLRILLHSRWPQFLLRTLALAGFVFTIFAGLVGSPVGSHNFAIIFVWIAWWTALKLFFIPFGGRSWCSICPIPMPGEWLQQRGLLHLPGKTLGLGRRWPRSLRGSWLQAGGFLLVGLFAAVTLTSARVTALVLLGIIALALGLSLVFERRAFCRFLCPIGGFTGLYAQAGPVAVRVKEVARCARHPVKTCYARCPWGQYPLALKSSANCGLCLECLRACPEDNIAVSLRPWGREFGPESRSRLDEAFLGLVMLSSALVDAAVFLGPWGGIKAAAYAVGSPSWFIFAGAFLVLALLVFPGLYAVSVLAGQKLAGSQAPLRKALARQSQVLIPLGLAAWIAFTVAFAFTKASYIPAVIADPFGWGWNLTGAAGMAAAGQASPFSLLAQVVLLAGGLAWAARIARRKAGSLKPAAPLIAFSALFSLAMLWLLVG